ncbi:hypothetical protein Tco_0601272, partial [Tanacetum coccineum]
YEVLEGGCTRLTLRLYEVDLTAGQSRSDRGRCLAAGTRFQNCQYGEGINDQSLPNDWP